MPDNSSGFVDFNQYSDLNRDEETRMLEQAMARAEAASADAQGKLRGVKREAAGRYGADGQITGEASDIAQTASYSDYLSAKGNAEKAWAAVTASTRNPYADAMRGQIGAQRGVDATAGTAREGLNAQDAAARAQIAGQSESLGRQRTAQAAEKEAKAKALKERADFDAGNYATHMQGIQDRLGKVWAGRDQRATASFGTPGAGGAQKWTGYETGQMDELGRLAKQNGVYDAWGDTGAWDADVEYGQGASVERGQKGFGNVGVTAGNDGSVTYNTSGVGNTGLIGRRNGFKGWGK